MVNSARSLVPTVIAFSLLCVACGSSETNTVMPETSTSAPTSSIAESSPTSSASPVAEVIEADGEFIWPDGGYVMAGYGYRVDVVEGIGSVSVETATTCVPLGAEPFAEFIAVDIEGAPTEPSEVVVRVGDDQITDYIFVPTSEDAGCAHEDSQSSDAAYSARALMEVLDERYPFFELRGIDWTEYRQRWEPVLAASEDTESFSLAVADMFEELGDGHTTVDGVQRFGVREQATLDGFDPTGTSDLAEASRMIGQLMSSIDLSAGAGGTNDAAGLTWGWLNEEIAYMRLDTFVLDPAEASAAFDVVFDDVGDADGIVVDLRLNGGGFDAVAIELASRFTESSYLGFVKYAHSNEAATRQDVWIQADDDPFEGRVAVLTSALTASASENFILSLMPRTEPPLLVGEATAGEHSDVIPWLLPNGVSIGMSMEVFEDSSGTVWEAVGLGPDFEVPFKPSDVDTPSPAIAAVLSEWS